VKIYKKQRRKIVIKNRTAQIIFQTIYCTLGLVGTIACLGIFDDFRNFRWDFYTYFTNLSNFLCFGVMLVALIQTIKRKEDGYVTATPLLKFIGMLGIVLTFLVFNVMLAGQEGRDPQLNWRIGSICFHVVLPIMYVVDWFLFYERKNTTWRYPIASIAFPLAYAVFLLIHATILGFNSSILTPTGSVLIYPYFFVNLEKGVPYVLTWIAILSVAFVAMGFIFYALDRLTKKRS
jgi:hypothetical protein